MRIVSLVPSSTETLLGFGAGVIACTRFCEQPDLRHVGGTKNPDIATIVALGPDLVVMDEEENRREDADALRAAGIELFVSDVTSVSDSLQVTQQLSAIAGGPAVIEALPPSVASIAPFGLSVFVPIWRRPWMTINGNTYGASLLDHLGCTLVTDALDAAYPEVALDDVAGWLPDVIAVPSEPYDFGEDHLAELREASPSSTVVRVDGQDLFWWGSRTPSAIQRLHRQLDAALS